MEYTRCTNTSFYAISYRTEIHFGNKLVFVVTAPHSQPCPDDLRYHPPNHLQKTLFALGTLLSDTWFGCLPTTLNRDIYPPKSTPPYATLPLESCAVCPYNLGGMVIHYNTKRWWQSGLASHKNG